MFSRVLLSAAVILGVTGPLVNAAVIENRDFSLVARTSAPTGVTAECRVLNVGQKPTDGKVCISVNGDYLDVTYSHVTGSSYKAVHVWIGTGTPPTTAPGEFAYTSENGYCAVSGDSAACHIPLKLEGDLCSTEYSIAAHADLDGETGWGDGECINPKCAPWASYSTFKFVCDEEEEEEPCTTTKASTTTTPCTTTTPSTTPEPSTTSSAAPTKTPATTKTTTSVVTYTTTTCPVTKPCYPVTSTAIITATLIQTVTVPCETSTYVSQGSTIVSTITKAPITTYVPCPGACPGPYVSPSPKVTVYNTTVSIGTEKPVPTKPAPNNPAASPFTGGSASLGISFGSVVAVVALFGLML